MVQKNQKELAEKLHQPKTLEFLGHMNSILQKNGENNGKEEYMVGKGVSCSVLVIFIISDAFNITI